MRVPISWLRDFVEVGPDLPDLARRLTLAGLEVESIHLAGLALGAEAARLKVTGLAWDPEMIVVGSVLEVMAHPNADRLVLCRLDDGRQVHTVLTGAPNLFRYKGKGILEAPLKVAYAREGARLFDGHKPGWELMTLQRAVIRGVESYSMACSEKELGISEEHEGVILLDPDASTGQPLVDHMGDAVFEIALTPNMARNASILGVAREVAALTGASFRPPSYELDEVGPALAGRVDLRIGEPELNPRFVLGLIEGVKVGPSPYQVQRRLRLAGMRPINNVVDATNYVMLEIGQPLHAFDFEALQRRAEDPPPQLSTRRAVPGERLTTLDQIDRPLDDFSVLVCNSAGPLSIAGVMGGAATEVGPETRSVLLEGAAWNLINIRRTLSAQRFSSEAAYRFSRGVHPAMAERGVRRGLSVMARLTGGAIARGLLDEYPLPPSPVVVDLSLDQVERGLGVRLEADEVAGLLGRLEFEVEVRGASLRVTPPDHRLDIGEGLIGVADVLEEIARVYGYDRIPETLIADSLPPQRGNPQAEAEEAVRDLLVGIGLQEVVTYRITNPGADQRHLPDEHDREAYVTLANPIASDRTVMRHHLLPSLLEVVARNAAPSSPPGLVRDRAGLPGGGGRDTCPRRSCGWGSSSRAPEPPPGGSRPTSSRWTSSISRDFLEALSTRASSAPGLVPGRLASVLTTRESAPNGRSALECSDGWGKSTRRCATATTCRQLLWQRPILTFRRCWSCGQTGVTIAPVPTFPPVLEDLALVVDEGVAADRVAAEIRRAGGDLLADLRLFDLYQGPPIPPGRKSLAYSLTYQAPDRTLTDSEVRQIREGIVAHLVHKLSAELRK